MEDIENKKYIASRDGRIVNMMLDDITTLKIKILDLERWILQKKIVLRYGMTLKYHDINLNRLIELFYLFF